MDEERKRRESLIEALGLIADLSLWPGAEEYWEDERLVASVAAAEESLHLVRSARQKETMRLMIESRLADPGRLPYPLFCHHREDGCKPEERYCELTAALPDSRGPVYDELNERMGHSDVLGSDFCTDQTCSPKLMDVVLPGRGPGGDPLEWLGPLLPCNRCRALESQGARLQGARLGVVERRVLLQAPAALDCVPLGEISRRCEGVGKEHGRADSEAERVAVNRAVHKLEGAGLLVVPGRGRHRLSHLGQAVVETLRASLENGKPIRWRPVLPEIIAKARLSGLDLLRVFKRQLEVVHASKSLNSWQAGVVSAILGVVRTVLPDESTVW